MLLSKFTGKTMIFRNENGFYRTSISAKNREGEYINKGINVSFKKGTDIPDRAIIDVKNGWLTFDEYVSKKDNEKKLSDFKIFVSDFTIEGDKTQESKSTEDSFVSEDLPF